LQDIVYISQEQQRTFKSQSETSQT